LVRGSGRRIAVNPSAKIVKPIVSFADYSDSGRTGLFGSNFTLSRRLTEADIIVDHCVRSDRNSSWIGQIEFAETDLVTPDLTKEILEYLDRQLFTGTSAIAETKWREASIVTHRLLTMMALVPDEPSRWLLYLCVAIFGGTIVPTYSVVMAHVNDAVGEGEFVAASGGLLIMQGAGAVAGPLLAGLAMSASERGLAYTLIATQILMAAFGVYRLTRRAAPPEMHKGIFVIEPLIPVGTTLESAHSRTD
jgi:hypothetical protein